MKTKILIAFLVIALAACAPVIAIAPTGTSVPTAVPPTFTATVKATIIAPTSTPAPQSFIPIITPDAIQVEKWKEYQTELAKVVLSETGSVEYPFYEIALCEWDILGRSGQEVYVWAVCSAPSSGGETPAVIHLKADGSIEYVEVPGHGSTMETNIQKMFPADVRAKFDLYYSSSFYGRTRDLMDHLQYRQTHPEEPPLIVLSATPAATPTP